jgi:hypothetical protein
VLPLLKGRFKDLKDLGMNRMVLMATILLWSDNTKSHKTWQEPGNKQKTTYKYFRKWLIILLSRQVSNLKSSDPEEYENIIFLS